MSSGSSKQTVEPGPISPEQARLVAQQELLARQQVGAVAEAREFIDEEFPQFDDLIDQIQAEADREATQAEDIQPIQDELLQIELDRIRSGGEATEEDIRLIEEAASGALEAGTSDILAAQRQSTELLREELAPSLGLRPSDTPILDRGARIAEESVRQQGQLSRNVRTAQAEQRLAFPLERSRITSAQTQGQQQFLQSVDEFQAQLREAAFLNRLQLSSTETSARLGLATGIPSTAPTISALNSARGGTTSGTQGASPLSLGFGALGAAGAFAQGLGAVGISSKQFKEDDGPVERILDRVKRLPIRTWRYKSQIDPHQLMHIGPYAEDWHRLLSLGDGQTIHFLDGLGICLQAIKDLADDVDVLKASA